MIFVNFKTYPESSGDNAVEFAKLLKTVSAETNVPIIACPQEEDMRSVADTGIEVWAQHVDDVERGRATGWFPSQIAKESGAIGTLLNHSEHKLDFAVLKSTHARAKESGLKTLIFAADVEEAKKVEVLAPNYIGYEPPELIGSKETSVARAKPQVIKDVVDALTVPVIVGAGVKDSKDIKTSLDLGAVGVALASGLVKSDDQKKLATELALAFK